MTTAAIQTIWCELVAATLADAGIGACVISPGSRSTPLVAALANEPRLSPVTIIDERAAAFFALGAARATGLTSVLVCTSGTAAAHYLPALVEASYANVPVIAITADRPPELQACGAAQTIDQVGMYGGFVRGAFDLGAPCDGALALRAVRRKIVQALTLARGPHAGPVHVELPLRKPLEPAPAITPAELALARAAAELRGAITVAPATLAPDRGAIAALADAIAREPNGVIVAGALPLDLREPIFALAASAGYPVIAEAGSQLRFGARPSSAACVDHFDLIPHDALPAPRLALQLGSEPVAAGWPGWLAADCARWVVAGPAWHDADSSARGVITGEEAATIEALAAAVRPVPRDASWIAAWRDVEARAARAAAVAIEAHPRSETAVLRAALASLPAGALVQVGNSLPIRVIDHVPAGGRAHRVLTQRGAAGIDGLIASAAGATRAGAPVLLVLGDVSFAHDVGGLLAARVARAPLAILVIDNRGGQIFAGLPIAKLPLGAAFERHWSTPPDLDPAAVATALGARAITAGTPAAVAAAVADALAAPAVTVIHAPVTASGAHDVRKTARDQFAGPPLRVVGGAP